jgi:Electron transfer flavoprotein domain
MVGSSRHEETWRKRKYVWTVYVGREVMYRRIDEGPNDTIGEVEWDAEYEDWKWFDLQDLAVGGRDVVGWLRPWGLGEIRLGDPWHRQKSPEELNKNISILQNLHTVCRIPFALAMYSTARHTVLRQLRTSPRFAASSTHPHHSNAFARLLSSLAVLEQRDGKLNVSSLAAVTAAVKLGGSVTGLVAGKGVKAVAEEAAKVQGLEKIIYVENEAYDRVSAALCTHQGLCWKWGRVLQKTSPQWSSRMRRRPASHTF